MTVVALVVLVGAGYFPARLLTGARWAAVLVAPLTTALLLTVCAIPCAVVGLPFAVATGGAFAVAVACAWAVHRRAPRPRDPSDSPWVLCIPLGGLVPFLTATRAPVAWDARSIWWFHARWWSEGPTELVQAIRNPAFAFSHPDYPPLTPSTIGAVWSLLGTRSFGTAQWMTAVLTLSALSTLGYAVWRLFLDRLPTGWLTVAAAGLVAAAYGLVGVDTATNGFVDALWGATFAAAAVFLLATPTSERALRWGSLLLAGTALTKNEAAIAALVLGTLTVLRYGWSRRALVWTAVALAPGMAWMLLARVLGAQSEDRWNVAGLARWEPSVTDRIGPSLGAVQHELIGMAVVTLVLTAIGLHAARSTRRAVGGSAFPWMWCAWAGAVAPLVLAYVVSNRDLDWHLTTSVARTTIAPNLVLLTEAAIWTLTLAAAWRTTPAPSRIDPGPVGAAP